jgi:predicted peptidase
MDALITEIGARGLEIMLKYLIVLLFALAAAPLFAETGLVARSVEVDGTTYGYQVFVPSQWTSDETWPVILFLHGAGERGDDGLRQLDEGLPEILRDRPDFPAVVVMPQCHRGMWWGDPAMEAQTFEALDASMSEFNGDPARVYLTGLSLGGYGTWAFGYKYPNKFAALAPVCGGVTPSRAFVIPEWHPAARSPADPFTETARGLGDVPVWAFHGDSDRRVPVEESRNLTNALEKAGGNVRYTEYAGVGHNSWDRAYAEADLIAWLLSHANTQE